MQFCLLRWGPQRAQLVRREANCKLRVSMADYAAGHDRSDWKNYVESSATDLVWQEVEISRQRGISRVLWTETGSKWGVLQLRRNGNTAWRGLMCIAGESLLSELHVEQMSAADVFYICSVTALHNSRILNNNVPLAANTSVSWYISAFCWNFNTGPVHFYQSHLPAATDMKIVCICPLGCFCRFVSVCRVTFRRDIYLGYQGNTSIFPWLFVRGRSVSSFMIWFESFLGV